MTDPNDEPTPELRVCGLPDDRRSAGGKELSVAWRVARSLDTLFAQFNARYPTRSRASDGSIGDTAHQNRSSDHNPWYGPGIVTARDFTHDPAVGMDIGRLTDELAASRDPRIKYLIANGLILDSRPGNRPWQWVRYTGSNSHRKHFHLSVMPSLICDDTRPWNLPSLGTNHPEVDLPTPAELWGHHIDDPYPGAGTQPAAALVGWAATHAAKAREVAEHNTRRLEETVKAILDRWKQEDARYADLVERLERIEAGHGGTSPNS